VHIGYIGKPKKRDKKREGKRMARKTVKARSLAVILLFALAGSLIGLESTGTAYAVSRPTIPPCTLNIVAVTATGNKTLYLTNDTIADYIQAGALTELSGNANMTNEPGGGTKWYMDQYRGVSILGLVNLVCQLQSNSTVTVNSAYDGYKVTFNYTYIAQGQINTYTNTSALTYNSGGYWTGASPAYSMVPHNPGENLTAIIAYYINPVNGGVNNGGPTAFKGWQPLNTTGSPPPGPLRNMVLGCANHHYTWTRVSDADIGEIIIHNPGPITTRSVGGYLVPVNKIDLLAPYIGAVTIALVGTVAVGVYRKRNQRKKKQ
jgi:hypothetical protein